MSEVDEGVDVIEINRGNKKENDNNNPPPSEEEDEENKQPDKQNKSNKEKDFSLFGNKKLIKDAEEAIKINKNEDAIDIYTYLIKKNKKDVNNYFRLGKLYMNMKLYENALRVFNKGIKYSNQKDALFLNKGVCLFNLEKYEEALEA